MIARGDAMGPVRSTVQLSWCTPTECNFTNSVNVHIAPPDSIPAVLSSILVRRHVNPDSSPVIYCGVGNGQGQLNGRSSSGRLHCGISNHTGFQKGRGNPPAG